MALCTISLCSGIGGLELGVHRATGGQTRVVCWVEWSIENAAVLASLAARGEVDDAPIWSDVKSFDGAAWRGRVDLVTAGFPCQPFSVAGKQQGHDDPRHLWPHIERIIGECEPEWVLLENVPGLLSTRTADGERAVAVVIEGLGRMGYRAEAGLFTAAEVAAPHKRERLFLLAHAGSHRIGLPESQTEQREDWEKNRVSGENGAALAHAVGTRWQEAGFGCHINAGPESEARKRAVADPERERGCSGETRCQHAADADATNASVANPDNPRRTEVHEWLQPNTEGAHQRPTWPPSPSNADAWAAILRERPDLAPALTQPEIRALADGVPGGLARSQQLRQLGNAVVPAQAERAWRVLMRRFEDAVSTVR